MLSSTENDSYFNEMFASNSVKFSELIHYLYFTKFADILSSMFKVEFDYLNDVPLKGSSTVGEENNSNPSVPFQMEEMIPCEFCTDSIPLSRFEAHVLLCRTGRTPLLLTHLLNNVAALGEGTEMEAGGGRVLNIDNIAENILQTARIVNRANQTVENMFRMAGIQVNGLSGVERLTNNNSGKANSEVKQKRISKLRPQANSPIVALLIEKLMNFFLEIFLSHKPLLFSLHDTNSDFDQAKPATDSSLQTLRIPKSINEFIESIFHQLDRDNNGFINIHDFSDEDKSFSEFSSTIDPLLLYGKSAIGHHTHSSEKVMIPKNFVNKFIGSPPQKRIGIAEDSDDDDDDDEELQVQHPLPLSSPSPTQLQMRVNRSPPFASPSSAAGGGKKSSASPSLLLHSPALPLQKTDSLWASVSNEKSLPVRQSSRSYSHLDEMEEELLSVIQRTQDIIDDSESTAIALLLHYSWDMKSLVEEYIDNHRLIRKVVGLGIRNKPSFYRYDYYLNEILLSKEETITMTCNICRDEVESVDTYALSCCHWFCSSCWELYLDSAIGTDHKLIINCPSPDCHYLVLNEMQRFFCSNPVINESKRLLLK
jgi:hypothetical protein